MLILCSDGCLVGDNIDGIGMVRDIMYNYDGWLVNKKILVVGVGGVV